MPSGSGQRMIEMGGTALPDWSMVPAPTGDNVFFVMVMTLIQLLGIVGIGKGVSQIMKYYKPNAQNPPENLGKPFMMVVFGMFALVPTRVYALFMDAVTLMGWG